MGKAPGEIEAEIERLRSESEEIVEELERRASVANLVQGAAAAVADTASSVVGAVTDTAGNVASEVVAGVPEIVRNNRQVVRGAALSAMLALGVYAASMMFKRLTATAWRSAMHEEPLR